MRTCFKLDPRFPQDYLHQFQDRHELYFLLMLLSSLRAVVLIRQQVKW